MVRVIRLRALTIECPNGARVSILADPEDGIYIDEDTLILGSLEDVKAYECSEPN